MKRSDYLKRIRPLAFSLDFLPYEEGIAIEVLVFGIKSGFMPKVGNQRPGCRVARILFRR
jgi:hypothetical protein